MKKLFLVSACCMAGFGTVTAQWSLSGNAISSGNFLGTTNFQPLYFKVSNYPAGGIDLNDNTVFGFRAGHMPGLTGNQNSAMGIQSLASNTSGSQNSAVGMWALESITTGNANTAVGLEAMWGYRQGSANTAVGALALFNTGEDPYTAPNNNTGFGTNTGRSQTTGSYNTIFGSNSQYSNTVNSWNTSLGYNSLNKSNNGYNVALGAGSLYSATTGFNNTSTGFCSAFTYTSGQDNVLFGNQAHYFNTTGNRNVVIGRSAMQNSTTGFDNTAFGYQALYYASSSTTVVNIAVGTQAMLNVNNCGGSIGIGAYSLYGIIGGSNGVAVGAYAMGVPTSATNNAAAGYGANTANGTVQANAVGAYASATSGHQVVIGYTGMNFIGGYADWTNFSDGRYKKNIQENVPGLNLVNQLRPVTYTLDIKGINQFTRSASMNTNLPEAPAAPDESALQQKEAIVYTGFISQEVDALSKKLQYDFSAVVTPQGDKDFYGLRYEDFVPLLVKSAQELGRENASLTNTLVQLQAQLAEAWKQLNDLKKSAVSSDNNNTGSSPKKTML